MMAMKGKTLAMILVVVACCSKDATAAINFEGCFRDIDESKGVSYNLSRVNLNEDCAHFCSSAGYILAATKASTCHCSNHNPSITTSLLQAPHEVAANGDTMCNTVCPAAAHTLDAGESCQGDTCCGNAIRNYYTVYAVGGINLRQLILKRIRRAVSSTRMPWITESYTGGCTDDFHKFRIQRGYAKLLVEDDQCTVLVPISSEQRCKEECIMQGVRCRSFSYSPAIDLCMLNQLSTYEADIEPMEIYTVLYDRHCPETLSLSNGTEFSLDLINQLMEYKTYAEDNLEPLGNNDFKLDLTHSNSVDVLRRSFDNSVGETTTASTGSGFEMSSSDSARRGDSSFKENTRDSSTTDESAFSTNFGLSVKATASVQLYGLTGGVSVGVHGNIGTSRSSSSTSSASSTSGSSSERSFEQDRSNSLSYNSGYNKVRTSQTLTTMSYSLTVPEFHKGVMTFSKSQQKRITKIRSTFQLNGYVKFFINGREKDVHVSRVLKGKDRLFATLTTMVTDRPVITAKTTITDSSGTKITSSDQISENRQ